MIKITKNQSIKVAFALLCIVVSVYASTNWPTISRNISYKFEEINRVKYKDDKFKAEIINFDAFNFIGLIYGDNGDPLNPQPPRKNDTNIYIDLKITPRSKFDYQSLKIENLIIKSGKNEFKLNPKIELVQSGYANRIKGSNVSISATTSPNTFNIGDSIYAEFTLIGPNYKSKTIKTRKTLVDEAW